MTSFASQIGTKTASDELVPFGWTRSDKRFRDDIAHYEQCRARIDGRAFGRRMEPPAKTRQLVVKTADRAVHYPADAARKALRPHPESLFRR